MSIVLFVEQYNEKHKQQVSRINDYDLACSFRQFSKQFSYITT